jgi:hypothetical protein
MKVLGILLVLLSWTGYVTANNMEKLAGALPSCAVSQYRYVIGFGGSILIYLAAMHCVNAPPFTLHHHRPNVHVYGSGLYQHTRNMCESKLYHSRVIR